MIYLANIHHVQWSNEPYRTYESLQPRMAVHSKNEALICKVFPSSLEPVAMRWFNGLKEGSIRSFKELTRAFGA